MATFADALAPAAPPAQTKLGFGDVLAAAFGAGPDRTTAYQKGVDMRGQVQLRSAQTENALAEAEKRRAETLRQQQINDAIAKATADPNFQPDMPFYAALAANAADMSQAALRNQELGFRGRVADTGTPQEERLSIMDAITGKPVDRFYQSGNGMQASQLDPRASPVVTPVGQAQIAADKALETQRLTQPAGGFTVGGMRYNLDGTPAVDVGVAARNAAAIEAATTRAREGAKPSAAPGSKPLTEFQGKALSHLSKMEGAEAALGKSPFYTPGLKDRVADSVPLVGNYLTSKPYQDYMQAAREWIAGMLRRDSGAAVRDQEFDWYFKMYFPQPGEENNTELLATKAAARAREAATVRASLGDAAQPPPVAPVASVPAAGGKEPTPKTQAEYDALPKGTVYLDTDGKRKRKR